MDKYFVNGHVIDVAVGCVRNNCAIKVRDGRIASLGGAVPDGAQTVDMKGGYIMPGLFNAHTHILFDSSPQGAVIYLSEPRFTIAGISNLRKYIDSGVTFIRDMAGAKYVDIELRDMLKEGRIVGPDMLAGGKNISATGGQSWENGIEADGVPECRKAVRSQCKMGVDLIKLMASGGGKTKHVHPDQPAFSLEEMEAIVEEATRWQRPVCAHAIGGLSAKFCAVAGVHSIEHGFRLDDETTDLMAEKGIYYVPTLAIFYFIEKSAGRPGITPAMVENAKRQREDQFRSLSLARKKGIRICAGNDACSQYNDHDSTWGEIDALCELGMNRAEALRAATLTSAQLCGVEEDLGSIEAGKKAHLAVFAENPLENVLALKNCLATYKNGEEIGKNAFLSR